MLRAFLYFFKKQVVYLAAFYLLFFSTVSKGQFPRLQIGTEKISYKIKDTDQQILSVCSDIGTTRIFHNTEDNEIIISIEDLTPASMVPLCIQKQKNGITWEEDIILMTRSLSSGEIKVFFNKPVDSTFRKNDYKPHGTEFGVLQAELRNLIRRAKNTIDVAAYNVNELFFVNELIDAHNRGIRVRYITDDETSNTGLSSGVPFPVLRGNTGEGLMHNKFIVVDENSIDESWVVMGSMNFTSNQMRRDPNHLIFIQDQALAKAYVSEFEEMWGGDGALPNFSKSRFGNQKIRNTPTNFVIGNIPVELYFSPSDQTTARIASALESGGETMLLALMIFTNWELRDKVVSKTMSGVNTRWIVDDFDNSGQVMAAVQSAGGQVIIHSHPDIFHHKYALLDDESDNPVLITGSHNWTFSAETRNDENTIIFHDKGLANIFRQDYEARWQELVTSTKEIDEKEIFVYPNPSSGEFYFSKPVNKVVVRDIHGRIVFFLANKITSFQSELSPGIYFCQADNKMIKIIVQR